MKLHRYTQLSDTKHGNATIVINMTMFHIPGTAHINQLGHLMERLFIQHGYTLGKYLTHVMQ